LPAAATWWGIKLTAIRPRQSPFAMPAASERTFPELFAYRNAAKRNILILFLFVSHDCPCLTGMFLWSSSNRK
jgi:hypothetical protein